MSSSSSTLSEESKQALEHSNQNNIYIGTKETLYMNPYATGDTQPCGRSFETC